MYTPNERKMFMAGIAGLSVLQTRGYDGAGVCAIDPKGGVSYFHAHGKIDEAFNSQAVESFKNRNAQSWVFQTRYGTHGNADRKNIQPIIRRTKETGRVFAVVHNGNFLNGDRDGDISDTVVFADTLANTTEENFDKCVVEMQEKNSGAWSLAITTKDAMYLMRDSYGIRPLSLGIKNGTYIAASETAALEAMGIEEYEEIMPGMVIKIDDSGLSILKHPDSLQRQAPCAFENAYIADGQSKAHLPRENNLEIKMADSINDFRRKTGRILARQEDENFADSVDFVVGIPGTGIAGGKAYAKELGVPYMQVVEDSNNGERTFMTPDIENIPERIRNHFKFKEFIKGMNIVCVDDSIVRSNVSKGLVKTLKQVYRAKSVHFRVLFPPVDKPCYLGISTRHKEELIAARHKNTEGIREEMGADSLKYVTAEDIQEASGTTEICLGCTIGQHPPMNENRSTSA